MISKCKRVAPIPLRSLKCTPVMQPAMTSVNDFLTLSGWGGLLHMNALGYKDAVA